MEVGEAVLALDFINPQFNLAECVVLVLLKISEGDLKDTALEGVVGILQTGSAVDEGLSNTIPEWPLSALIQPLKLFPYIYPKVHVSKEDGNLTL